MTHAQNAITLSVKRIKEFGFYLNETLYAEKVAQNADKPLQVGTSLQLSFTLDTNMVFLLIRVYYHFPNAEPTEILTDIHVQNVFEIEDLKRFQVAPSEIILPSDTITAIVGLSLSHTRALLAKNLSGTLLQENLMAVYDPSRLAKHFFPRMFEENSVIHK
ncbi:MAG TPA: hypothetical protein VGN00_10775 [Puia sp.]|jgi:hypothetical protein